MSESSCGCGCGHDEPTTPGAPGAATATAAPERSLPVVPVEGLPELDATVVPHAIRHGVIFGGLESLAPGNGLILVAPHDPLPLLAQVEQRWPERYSVDYVQRGPQVWRLRFVRVAA